MKENNDIQRLRLEYSDRKRRFRSTTQYSIFNPSYLFSIQQRERILLRTLFHHGFHDFKNYRVLEIGCGDGRILTDFLTYGVNPLFITGIDLLYDQLKLAHQKLVTSPIINADGQCLPFKSSTFDLVLQFTAFSSILDDQIKQNMANEILRLIKPEGAIIWYDFWLNPINKQTRGIRPKEIKQLFKNCSIDFQKITLAPPIARRIVPLSLGLAIFLESLKFLNSHYLVFINKKSK